MLKNVPFFIISYSAVLFKFWRQLITEHRWLSPGRQVLSSYDFLWVLAVMVMLWSLDNQEMFDNVDTYGKNIFFTVNRALLLNNCNCI